MDNLDDLDNLMDNFDMKTFWKKRDLAKILAAFGIYVTVGAIFTIRAVLNSSEAGAVPKSVNVVNDAKGMIVR